MRVAAGLSEKFFGAEQTHRANSCSVAQGNHRYQRRPARQYPHRGLLDNRRGHRLDGALHSGRRLGTPEDIGHLAAFALAARRGRLHHRPGIAVDGGQEYTRIPGCDHT